jgi:glycosyltransferase involved in cell wall biosynthesis
MEEARRLRVAMVAACPFPCPRGTPIRILRLAEALGRRGHDVHVVTYHLGEPATGLPFTIHRSPRVPTYRKLSPGPTYQKLLVLNPLLRRVLRRVVREHGVDVVHAHHYEGLLIALSLPPRHRPPILYDAHTLLETELPFYRLGLPARAKRGLGRVLDRRLPGRAAHVIAVSERIRGQLVGLGAVAPQDISVVTNGVELELLVGAPQEGGIGRPAGKTVVFAGNTAGYQGIELLLEAFRDVRARIPDARLLVVTEDDFTAYEPLARVLGIHGSIDLVRAPFERLLPLLAAADVAVNPRPSGQGVPQKLMNYMAAARPIVSFAGSAAHLRHDQTAWIVADGDVAGLARGVVRLLEEPELASRLGAAARCALIADYSWERTAQRTEAVYARVLGRPGV